MKTFIKNLFMMLVLLAGIQQAAAQGTTAFTYQGQLRDGSTYANGTYTMIFKLYDAVSGTNQIGGAITNSPSLANGLFSVNLDFGGSVFDGSARWLDITVTKGSDTQTLAPRVSITPVPYALYALTSGSANTNGTITAGTVTATNVVLGGGGTSWDFSIDPSGALILAYGDPLVNVWATPDGNLSARSNIVAVNGDFVAPHGGLQLGGPTGTPWTISADNANYLNLASSGTTALSVQPHRTVASGRLNVINDGVNSGNISVDNGITAGGEITATGNMHAQAFIQTSDRNAKENIALIDAQMVLKRVADLPISSWNFKSDPTTRHIGPMAQDFYGAFNVGPDDKHITTVDEGGVALAAIQGLNEELKEKDAKIEAMEKRLADLEELIKSSTHK